MSDREDRAPVGTGPFSSIASRAPTASKCAANRRLLPRQACHRSHRLQALRLGAFGVGRSAAGTGRHAVRSRPRRARLAEPSNQVKVFSYRRHYAYMAIFNIAPAGSARSGAPAETQRWRSTASASSSDVLGAGRIRRHGPVWPDHWANDPAAAAFSLRSGADRGRRHCASRTARACSRIPLTSVWRWRCSGSCRSVGVDLELAVSAA